MSFLGSWKTLATLCQLLFLVSLPQPGRAQEQWVLAAPPAARGVLDPLLKRRVQQGYQVRIVPTPDQPAGAIAARRLQSQLQAACQNFSGVSRVLLVELS